MSRYVPEMHDNHAHAAPIATELHHRRVSGKKSRKARAKDAAIILATASDFATLRAMADILNADARRDHPDLRVPREGTP